MTQTTDSSRPRAPRTEGPRAALAALPGLSALAWLIGVAWLLGLSTLLVGCGGGTVVAPPPKVFAAKLVPPLTDARVGEELVLRRGEHEWRYAGVDTAETTVTVEIVEYVNGLPKDRPLQTVYDRNLFGIPDGAVIRSFTPDRLEQDGRVWICWRVDLSTSDRGNFTYWLTDEVAVHGVLKIAKVEKGDIGEDYALRMASHSFP